MTLCVLSNLADEILNKTGKTLFYEIYIHGIRRQIVSSNFDRAQKKKNQLCGDGAGAAATRKNER